MPSLEAAYPWLLALAGTSLFAGFGLARRLDAGTALRPRRLRVGTLVAVLFTVVAGTAFAGAAIANELALRDRTTPPATSRFGPTDAEAELPACDEALAAGTSSRLVAHLRADIDGRPIGTVDLSGRASATTSAGWPMWPPTASSASTGPPASAGGPGPGRRSTAGRGPTPRASGQTLDLQAVRTALPGVARDR